MGNFSSSSVHFAGICNLNLKKGGGKGEEKNGKQILWNFVGTATNGHNFS